MKKLTKEQARKYHRALLTAWPELGEVHLHNFGSVGQPRKPMRQELKIREAQNESFRDGIEAGRRQRQEEIDKLQRQLSDRSHRIEALKALTQYCSVAGQTIEAFSRAMQSEAGQL